MAVYICSYCGAKTNSPSGGSCSRSPHKNHEWIRADDKKEYVCAYCGAKTNSPGGGSCSSSPSKNHKWI